MMNANSENPKVGKRFQIAVKEWLEKNTDGHYELEYPIEIGKPAKPHKFDIAEKNGKRVNECKC